MTEPLDADPALVAAARSLADRARSDGISAAMLRQAATIKLRPGFAAALMFAIEQGWIEDPWEGVEKDGGPVDVNDGDEAAGEPFAARPAVVRTLRTPGEATRGWGAKL